MRQDVSRLRRIIDRHIQEYRVLGECYLAENLCRICRKRMYEQLHHLFEQTEANKKKYGVLIHHPVNLLKVCSICHLNKEIPHIDEEEFVALTAEFSGRVDLKKLKAGR